jgi:hypothetical protein
MPKGVYERSEKAKENIKKNLVKANSNSPISQGRDSMKEPQEFVPKTVDFIMRLNEMNAQPPSRENIKEMEQRFLDYLMLCKEYQLQPGNQACYLALGVTKQDMFDWENGVRGTTFLMDFAKKVKQIISAFRESAATEGKINTVWAIFMGKNYDGLKDQQDVVVTPNVIGQTDDATTLAEKYRDNLPMPEEE